MRTRAKLDTRIDYEDVDTGPTRAKYLRTYDDYDSRRTHREDYLYIGNLLRSSIGKVWNDVYSKFCEKYSADTYTGHWMRRSILSDVTPYYWQVNNRYGEYYFVDEDGILRYTVRQKYIHPVKPLEKIHYKGDTWFERQKFNGAPICGCKHFRPKKYEYYSYHNDFQEYCIHGNKPKIIYLWYVVEYRFHSPNEVYSAYGSWHTVYNSEKKQWVVTKTYYRDVPEKMRYVHSRKTANKKELQLIKNKGGLI